jgi:hypothetical protein
VRDIGGTIMFKKLLTAGVILALMGFAAFGSVDLHVKYLTLDQNSVIGPGLGWYSVNILGGWGFNVEYTIGVLNYETDPGDPCEEIPQTWALNSCGLLDVQGFYDFPIGGCDPGPCDVDHIRLGAGIGFPMAFTFASDEGLGISSLGIGGIISVGYVWPNWSVRWEAFYNGEMVHMLSAHWYIPAMAERPQVQTE